MTVSTKDRFSKRNPCPICGGYKEAPRSKGVRCWGFLSPDGKWANCVRDEYAGTLPKNPGPETYGHRLDGSCKCGNPHSPAPFTPEIFYPSSSHPSTPHAHRERDARGRIVKTYDYQNANGDLVHQTVRYDPKAFSQRRPDGFGGWTWNLQGVETVLYRLPELLALAPGSQVFVVEGEKDVDALVSLGLVATCNPMGAGKWRAHYAPFLAGHQVVVIQDADDPGRKHGPQVAESVAGGAASVKLLELPGAKDVSEWLALGHTAGELLALVDATLVWTPAPRKAWSRQDEPAQPPVDDWDAPSRPEDVSPWGTLWGRVKMTRRFLGDSEPGQVQTGASSPLGAYKGLEAAIRSQGGVREVLASSPTFEDLEPHIASWVEMKPDKRMDRCRNCGTFSTLICFEHGVRKTSSHPSGCKELFCAGCLSDAGLRIGKANIPPIPDGEGTYRVLLVEHPFELPAKLKEETPVEWAKAVESELGNEQVAFHEAVSKVSKRTLFHGLMVARVFQNTLIRRGNYWWGWVIVRDDHTQNIGERFMGALEGLLPDAKVIDFGETTSGDELAVLLMILTRSWLLTFDQGPELGSFAFEGAFNAHAKRRMFEPYGYLEKAIQEEIERAEEEKAAGPQKDKDAPFGRCDEPGCNRALQRRVVPQGVDPRSTRKGDKPAWADPRWAKREARAAPSAPPPAKRMF